MLSTKVNDFLEYFKKVPDYGKILLAFVFLIVYNEYRNSRQIRSVIYES